MKNVIVLVVVLLALAGCTSQTDASSDTPDNTTNGAPEMPRASINLSFSREADGVLNTETEFPKAPEYDFTNITTPDGRLVIYYFYSSGCGACNALRSDIERLKKAYNNVQWQEYDLVSSDGNAAYTVFAGQYNLSMQQRLVPQVLVNGTIITDRFNINDSLEGILVNFTSGGQK